MFQLFHKKFEEFIAIWPAIVAGIIVLAMLVYGGVLFFYGQDSAKYARLEIDSGGKKRAFEGEVFDNMTVFQALQAATLAGNLTFLYSIDVDGNKVLVEAINGYKSDQAKKPPEFYLNSTPLDVSKINSIIVKSGDSILVVLE